MTQFTKINNQFRSKVMKAAGTMYAKCKHKTSKNWASSLRRAWKWAKEKLMAPAVQGFAYREWSPRAGFVRFYFDDNSYVQLTARGPRGSYERHRACKGETFYWVKSEGDIASKVVKFFENKYA